MFIIPNFNYVVVRKAAVGRVSQFQAFDWGWIAATDTIFHILRLPANLLDVVDGPDRSIGTRAQGYGRHIFGVVDTDLLSSFARLPFLIFVSDLDTAETVTKYRSSLDTPTLHFSESRDLAIPLDDASINHFRVWLEELADFPHHQNKQYGDDLRIILNKYPRPAIEIVSQLDANSRSELACRFALAAAHLPLPPLDSPSAVLSHSYLAVRDARRRVVTEESSYRPGSTQLLLMIPGRLRSLPAVLPRELRSQVSPAAASAYKAIAAGTNVTSDYEVLAEQVTGTNDPEATSLFKERAAEMYALLNAFCCEASGQFLPSIEHESCYGQIESRLKALADQVRFGSNDEHVNRLAGEIGSQMSRSLDPNVRSELEQVTGTVRVLSDDPIEFLQVKGHPINLRCNTVRMPITPGLLLQKQLEFAVTINLSPADFSEILVLRTTQHSDPVHKTLEQLCDQVAVAIGTNPFRIVDVSSVRQMSRVLGEFSGALAVFDGHGMHAQRSSGQLGIGNESISLWELGPAQLPRFPPIVFLAACDTHPVDRAQDTSAAAILAAGARTVIGTLAPVGAMESASLLAHLLVYVKGTLPRYPTPVRFSELFGAAQRTAYVEEGLSRLRSSGGLKLSDAQMSEIMQLVVKQIANFRRSWFEDLHLILSRTTGETVEAIDRAWAKAAYFPDALLHCQLGQSDSVYLTPTAEWWDDRMKEQGFVDGTGFRT